MTYEDKTQTPEARKHSVFFKPVNKNRMMKPKPKAQIFVAGNR